MIIMKTHGGARVVRVHLLLDGDGGREARDAFHVGLVESAHELARIGTQALHIAALAFRVKRVERQGRLARSRQASDDHQFVLGNPQIDAFQVVDLRVANGDIGSCLLFQGSEKLNLQRYGKNWFWNRYAKE